MTTQTLNNISSLLIDASIIEINKKWVGTAQPDFLWNEILSRGAFLILAPAAVITIALDTIIGLAIAFVAISTLGMLKPSASFAALFLSSSNRVIAQPFSLLVKVINPHASFNNSIQVDRPDGTQHSDKRIKSISLLAGDRLLGFMETLKNSEYFLLKHLVSRGICAGSIPIFIVTKVFDTAIGFLAAPCALITLGSFETINIYATNGLTTTGIISCLFCCIMSAINPWSFDNS